MFVLIAHGSRDARWRKSLEDLADSLRARFSPEEVGLAFMQFDGLTLPELVEEGRSRGVSSFRLLPLFMASAGHVDKDIRPLVDELRGRYAELTLEILTPVGEDPRFWALVQDIAENAEPEGRS